MAQELGISCETKNSHPSTASLTPSPYSSGMGTQRGTVMSGQSSSTPLIFTQHLFTQLSTHQESGDMENGLRHHPALKRLPFLVNKSSVPSAFPHFHFPSEENGSIPPSRKNTEPSRPGGQRTCYSQYHHQSQMYHPPR